MDYRIEDSPSEKIRKELPNGNGDWNGFDHVYMELKKAVLYLAKNFHFSEDHIFYMAVLGCGHEETMKHYMAIAKSRGLA